MPVHHDCEAAACVLHAYMIQWQCACMSSMSVLRLLPVQQLCWLHGRLSSYASDLGLLPQTVCVPHAIHLQYCSVVLASLTLFKYIYFTACPGQKTLKFLYSDSTQSEFQLCPALKGCSEPCPPILELIIWAKLAQHCGRMVCTCESC